MYFLLKVKDQTSVRRVMHFLADEDTISFTRSSNLKDLINPDKEGDVSVGSLLTRRRESPVYGVEPTTNTQIVVAPARAMSIVQTRDAMIRMDSVRNDTNSSGQGFRAPQAIDYDRNRNAVEDLRNNNSGYFRDDSPALPAIMPSNTSRIRPPPRVYPRAKGGVPLSDMLPYSGFTPPPMIPPRNTGMRNDSIGYGMRNPPFGFPRKIKSVFTKDSINLSHLGPDYQSTSSGATSSNVKPTKTVKRGVSTTVGSDDDCVILTRSKALKRRLQIDSEDEIKMEEEDEEEKVDLSDPDYKGKKVTPKRSIVDDIVECQKCFDEFAGKNLTLYQKAEDHAVVNHSDIMRFKCIVRGCTFQAQSKAGFKSHSMKHKANVQKIEFSQDEEDELKKVMDECFPGLEKIDGRATWRKNKEKNEKIQTRSQALKTIKVESECDLCQKSLVGPETTKRRREKMHAFTHLSFKRYKCNEPGCKIDAKSTEAIIRHVRYEHDRITDGEDLKIELTPEQDSEMKNIKKKCFPFSRDDSDTE